MKPTSGGGKDAASDEDESLVLLPAVDSRPVRGRRRVTPRPGSGESSKSSSLAASVGSSAPVSATKKGLRHVKTLDATDVQRALLAANTDQGASARTGRKAVAPAAGRNAIGASHARAGTGGRATGMGDVFESIEEATDEGETTNDDDDASSGKATGKATGAVKVPAAPPRTNSARQSGTGTFGNATGKGDKRISAAPDKQAPTNEAGSRAGKPLAAEKSRLAGQDTSVGQLLASSDEESRSEDSDADDARAPAAGGARQVCRLTWGRCDFVCCHLIHGGYHVLHEFVHVIHGFDM